MRQLHFLLWIVLAPTLAAQSGAALFEKAPPHIDEALRSRIAFFYQSHVDGKFRAADTVVHEDSKDVFFAARKQRYKKFQISRINYGEGFTTANAVVSVDTNFLFPGHGAMPVTLPIGSQWKLDGGEWWWYVSPSEGSIATPFGTVTKGPEQKKTEVDDRIANMPTDASQITNQVRVSKTSVMLNAWEPSSDEVIITNGMPGHITLQFRSGSVPGYEAKLDRTELGPGEQAKILFHIDPVPGSLEPRLEAELTVEPIRRRFPITIQFLNAPVTEDPSSEQAQQ